MNATTVKPCACCDGQAIKRRHESVEDFRARRTCSRSCGQSLRRGIVKKTVATTPRAAEANIGQALQGWRIDANSTESSQPGA